MSRVHYFADGYIRETEGDIRQSTWVCMYNPTETDAVLDFTFYYEDVEPTWLPGHLLKAHSAHNMHLNSCPEVLWNKRFGAKVASSVPVIVQITTGYYSLEDKPDWYTRAMHSVICADSLSKTLYYADGLVLDSPGKRLKEPEWDFILNPNRQEAHAVLTAEYGDGIRGRIQVHHRSGKAQVLFQGSGRAHQSTIRRQIHQRFANRRPADAAHRRGRPHHHSFLLLGDGQTGTVAIPGQWAHGVTRTGESVMYAELYLPEPDPHRHRSQHCLSFP